MCVLQTHAQLYVGLGIGTQVLTLVFHMLNPQSLSRPQLFLDSRNTSQPSGKLLSNSPEARTCPAPTKSTYMRAEPRVKATRMDPVCALLSTTTAGMDPVGKCCKLHGGTKSGWRGRHRYSQDTAILRVGWTALGQASLWTDGVKFLTARSGISHKDTFKFLT